MKRIELDIETADKITVLSLKNYRDALKTELKEWKKNPKSDSNPSGYWLHPDDVVGNTRRIKLIEELLKDFEC